MLLRLIISQVCHCIVTWASKVLTSTSFSLSFAFPMQPGVSCSTFPPCLTIFFLLSPPFSLSTRHRWGKGFIGYVQCQIQWKTVEERRVEKKHPALKLDRNKGVVLWQDITAIFARRPWSLQSCHSLGDVVANKKVCELCSLVGGFHKTNNHINKTQQILGKVSPS